MIKVPDYLSEVFGFAADRDTAQGYRSLTKASQTHISPHGLHPAAAYIGPKSVVMWNSNNGGTDVMSRVLKKSPFHLAGVHPKAVIIWRIIWIIACNAFKLTLLCRTDEQKYSSYKLWRPDAARSVSIHGA